MTFRIVTYYRHSAANNEHTTEDYPAIVYAENGDSLSLFIIGDGPPRYERVSKFDPEACAKLPFEQRSVGHSYWRDVDSDAPDFASCFTPPEPVDPAVEGHKRDLAALEAKHADELSKLAPTDLGSLKEKQAKERADLEAKAPVPAVKAAEVQPGTEAPRPTHLDPHPLPDASRDLYGKDFRSRGGPPPTGSEPLAPGPQDSPRRPGPLL